MILFWTSVVALVAVALAMLLPPLLRRSTVSDDARNLNIELARERLRELEAESTDGALSPAELSAARDELKHELLLDVENSSGGEESLSGRNDVVGMLAMVIGVPLLAFALYGLLGDQNAVRGVPMAPQNAGAQEDMSIETMIARVEARLEQNPEDATGWLMLARSYSFAQRWDDAERAYFRASELAPDNVDVMVELAGVLGRRADGVLAGQPEQLLRTALQTDPQHMNAMFLMGHVHFQGARYEAALEVWQQVAARLEPGSADLQQLQGYIAEARGQLGLPQEAAPALAAAAPGDSTSDSAGESAGKSIRVSVDLAPALASAVAPDDTLFVYARATEGPRMPLAIARVTARDLPLTVTLDESMAMMPNLTLASFEQVTVEARISKTGSAIPQSGDIRGTRSPVSPGSDEMVNIVIDSRVP